jgi:hypothetical protein
MSMRARGACVVLATLVVAVGAPLLLRSFEVQREAADSIEVCRAETHVLRGTLSAQEASLVEVQNNTQSRIDLARTESDSCAFASCSTW